MRPLIPLTVLALSAVTACAVEPLPDPPTDPAAESLAEDGYEPTSSEISPDTWVSCRGEADECPADSSVLWSLPLDERFHLDLDDGSVPQTRMDAVRGEHDVHAAVDEGVLHHSLGTAVRAVDLSDGELLWEQEVGGMVVGIRPVGDTVAVVTAEEENPREGRLVLLVPEGDGVERVDPDLPEIDPRVLSSGRGHVVVRHEEEGEGGVFRVDVGTGDVDWHSETPGWIPDHGVVGGRVHVMYGPQDEPLTVTTLEDGEEVRRFELSDEMGRGADLWALDEKTLALGPRCGESHDGCGSGRITVIDAEDGDEVWTHEAEGTLLAHEDGELHVQDGEGLRALAPDSGEVLRNLDDEPAHPAQYEVRYDDFPEGEDPPQHRFDQVGLYLFSSSGGSVHHGGAAVGMRHLDTYGGPEGVAGLFLGCAPDGVGEAGLTSPTPERPCHAPRIFALGHGS